MKYVTLLFVCLALSLPAALTAADFEGTVHMTVTSGKHTSSIEYQVKSGQVRTNISTGKGEVATAIMDFTKGQMLILIPGQKMYMVRPLPPLNTPVKNPAKASARPVVATTETEIILGYTCTKYLAPSAEGNSVEMWVTTELGNFAGFGGGMGPGGGHSSTSQEWAKLAAGQGFFPLRVVTKNASGTETARMEVSSIDKTALPDSTFAAPAGYQELNMANMIGSGFGRP